jgi:hypothetical protein
VIKGKDWVPYIVKWTAKIAPKQSYPTARKKIWKDLELKIRFSHCRSIDYFGGSIDMNSKWIDRQFWWIDRHTVHLNFLLFKTL